MEEEFLRVRILLQKYYPSKVVPLRDFFIVFQSDPSFIAVLSFASSVETSKSEHF